MSGLREIAREELPRIARLTGVAIGLALGLGLTMFVVGCGEAGALDRGASATTRSAAASGSAAAVVLPEVPPIDLLAPVSFETAAFALG
jgi:hypothetical protein